MSRGYLLDTCTFLWMLGRDELLSVEARRIVCEAGSKLLLSAASSWEIALKVRLGKLDLGEEPASYVPSRMDQLGIDGLAVEHVHALATHDLPLHHRDPFDRLLIAQARCEDLLLLTPDPAFSMYDVRVSW